MSPTLIWAAFLLRAKLVHVTLALNTTHFLHNERAFLPWDSAVNNLNYFILMFDRSEVYGPMQACKTSTPVIMFMSLLILNGS